MAVACGVIAAIAFAWSAWRAWGPRFAAPIAALAWIAPLAWRATTAIGSESPALMLAAIAILGATFEARAAAWIVGASVGLGLGVRASWAPLFVATIALVPRGARLRASLVAALATVAWLVPFVAVVGPRELASLVGAQAAGHFTTWGGAAITDVGFASRASWLARDLFVDGLGAGTDALGVAIALRRSPSPRSASARGARAAWPTRGWPSPCSRRTSSGSRSVKISTRSRVTRSPVVVAIAAALGRRPPRRAPPAPSASCSSRSSPRAPPATPSRAARESPPPGAQLVALADASPSRPVAVFGGPSARFFDLASHDGVVVFTAGSLGDAQLALGRLPSLPSRVLVTSELEDVAPTRDLVHAATLCRPPRIDRRAPCLDVYDWRPTH